MKIFNSNIYLSKISAINLFNNKKDFVLSKSLSNFHSDTISFGSQNKEYDVPTIFSSLDGKKVNGYLHVNDSPEKIDIKAYDKKTHKLLGELNASRDYHHRDAFIHDIDNFTHSHGNPFERSKENPVNGVGTALFREYEKILITNHPDINSMLAMVTNTGSAKFHNKMGFDETDENYINYPGEETIKRIKR